MFFQNGKELINKGTPGKLFFYNRFVLCALPIGVTVFCLYWAIITGSKDWIKIVNTTILALNIVVMIFSIASLVLILLAVFDLFPKIGKLLTYLYCLVTIIAFICGFVLLSFSNEYHGILYLFSFDNICGEANRTNLVFPTPVPIPAKSKTFLSNQEQLNSVQTIENNFSPKNEDKIFRDNKEAEDSKNGLNYINDGDDILINNDEEVTIDILSETNHTTDEPNSLCEKYWTFWSRKKFIRQRTQDAYSAFAGILSPWVIFFSVEIILVVALNPPKKKENPNAFANIPLQEEENDLYEPADNVNLDRRGNHDAANLIFRDELHLSDENSQSDSTE